MERFKKFLFHPVDSLFGQLPRALVSSCIGAGADIVTAMALVNGLHFPTLGATIVGCVVGFFVQYLLCTYWVFAGNSETHRQSFSMFALTSLVGLGITCAVVETLVHFVPFLAARLIALGVAFVWNFSARKWFVYRSLLTKSEPMLDLASNTSVEMS